MHMSKLKFLLNELNADDSLVIALQQSLKKTPAERGEFDSMAIDNVDGLLKESIASLQSDLDNRDNIFFRDSSVL